MLVVPRRAATQLYEMLHRRPCAVLVLAEAFVRTHPSEQLNDRKVLSVRRFCEYKAYTRSSEEVSADPSVWPTEFSAWVRSPDCEGKNDPRCLPLHIFSVSERANLTTAAERKRFELLHHHARGPARKDARKLVWTAARGKAMHGREPCTVSGCLIPDGFHWDVQSSSKRTLSNGAEEWSIRAGGYINIYPDGFLREGSMTRRVWSTSHSDTADLADVARMS